MKKLIITACLLVLISGARAQDKSAFDIQGGSSLKSSSIKKVSGYDSQRLTGQVYDATLISGGYFTLGTTAGISESSLDDNCTLTFGHPYALTSYPVISVDGTWYKPEDYFGGVSSLVPVKSGDTLSISAVKPGVVSYTFKIISQTESRSIKISGSATNLDSKPHSFGLGLLIDPALGKWGDAYFEIPTGKMFSGAEIPSNILLWEKGTGAKGIAMNIGFSSLKPEKIIAANWADLYQTQAPVFETDYEKAIYDLYMKFYWPESTVSSGSSISSETSISLPQPDFSSQVFLRWDLPNFLILSGNVLFPGQFDTFLEINNSGGISSNSLNLNFEMPKSLDCSIQNNNIMIEPGNHVYARLNMESHIVYEDKVVEAAVKLYSGTQLLDEIHRNIFIPATPISDTGLAVIDDSLDLSNFPEVNLFFGAKQVQTGGLLYNLSSDNVFLYENGGRVNDFNFQRAEPAGSKIADVAFVLDVSGSMGDNINQVVRYLGEFADSLAERGYDYRIGVVTFSTTVDHVWDFTSDIDSVKNNLQSIALWGGEEDSPSGLYTATELSYRPGSIRTIIWITDENYTEQYHTKTEVVNKMLEMGITVNGVGLTTLETDWFNPIVLPTGGKFYDIAGNFRDILLDISRMKTSHIFQLQYTSKLSTNTPISLKLEVHYGGLGAVKTYDFTPVNSRLNDDNDHLLCYPNPFNPTVTFSVRMGQYRNGIIRIFNLLGQKVREIALTGDRVQKISWNALNQQGTMLASGYYFVQLLLRDGIKSDHAETAKILYLK